MEIGRRVAIMTRKEYRRQVVIERYRRTPRRYRLYRGYQATMIVLPLLLAEVIASNNALTVSGMPERWYPAA